MSEAVSLGRRTVRGARTVIIGQGVRFLCQVVGLVVLSRILGADEFGVVALGLAVVGIGELLRDLGLATAAVRAPSLSRNQRDNLFWLNSFAGAVLAVAAVACAQAGEALFEMPGLAVVVVGLSPVFVLNGITAQYKASLNRSMKYRALAVTEALASLLGLVVSVGLALAGVGYWSLIAQHLTYSAAVAVGTIAFARWRPRAPKRRQNTRELVRFGWNITLAQSFGYVGNSIDTLVLGAVGSSSALGLYNRAYQLAMVPLAQLRQPATTVAIPALARVLNDRPRFMGFLLRGQGVIGYVFVPGAVVLAAAAEPAVLLVLGDDWRGTAPVVSILAVAAACQLLSSVGSWALVSGGRARSLRNYTIVSSSVKVALVLPLSKFGVVGVAVGYSAAVVLMWPVALVWAARALGFEARSLLLQGARMGCIGAVGGVLAHHVIGLLVVPSVLAVVIAVAAVAVVYGLAMIFRPVRSDIARAAIALKVAMSRSEVGSRG